MRPGWTIFLCVLTLLGVGLVMVRSADTRVSPIPTPEPLDFSQGAALLVVPDPPEPEDQSLREALLDTLASRSVIYAGIALLATIALAMAPMGLLDRLDALTAVRRPTLWLGLATVCIVGVLLLVYVPGPASRWRSHPRQGSTAGR